jgi:hypothetical protein
VASQKYPYTALPGRLRDLLASIPKMGVPPLATHKWMESIGYRGGNARTILPVLRFVGVVGKDGTPTNVWKALRRNDKGGRAEFAGAVRSAYADLFSTHPDAHRKDNEALRNFFRATTDAGDQAQQKMVQTFKVLTEFGDFDAVLPAAPAVRNGGEGQEKLSPKTPVEQIEQIVPGTPGVTLNVNIQLQLPATAESEVYEKLFAAMRKHLIDLTQSS